MGENSLAQCDVDSLVKHIADIMEFNRVLDFYDSDAQTIKATTG